MKEYLKNWHLMRILRLVLGVFILVQGIATREWLIAGLGGLFALLPLLNIGCCGVSGCNVPVSETSKKTDEILYEEVH